THVISNVAKYNTSVKIYLSKSKITDLKNYLKITKYTKKLLNYSNVSKSNSLLYTSGICCAVLSTKSGFTSKNESIQTFLFLFTMWLYCVNGHFWLNTVSHRPQFLA